MPEHEVVIDPALVEWEFDPAEGVPNGAHYQAAVIPKPPPSPPSGLEETGVIIPLTDSRMFDLLASKLMDDFWKPVLDRLRGAAYRHESGTPEHEAAMRELSFASRYDCLPYNIYGNVVPGKLPDGTEVIGIVAFYTEHERGNGHGAGEPSITG